MQAWYTSTYVAALLFIHVTCSRQAHAVQHNTTNTCGHAQSVIGPECSNDFKGSGLCIIAFRHLLRSAQQHRSEGAWWSTPHQCSLDTSTYVAALLFIHVNLLSASARGTTHAVQHNTTNTCGHAQSVIGPECSNDFKGSGLCIIAFRHLLRSAQQHRSEGACPLEVHAPSLRCCCPHVMPPRSEGAWCSTPHQCSLVHIHLCGCIAIYTRELALSKRTRYNTRGTTQHNQHMWTCAKRHRARMLKRLQGKWALHYSV